MFARAFDAKSAREVPYRHTDFSDLDGTIDPQRFYDDDYDDDLANLIARAIQFEAPVRDDKLATIIARAHGFARTGRLIKERVDAIARQIAYSTVDDEGCVFFWTDENQAADLEEYRVPASGKMERSINEISLEELALAANAVPDEGDQPVAVARLFLISRLRKSARKRVEIAIARLHS